MSGKTNLTIYSGTPCDECGGPTYAMPSGSIWCPDQLHGGNGHFVIRVAFERAPKSAAEATSKARSRAPATRVARPKPVASEPTADGFNLGYDAFVKGDR